MKAGYGDQLMSIGSNLIYLLIREQEVPASDAWLGPEEAAVAAGLRFPKRLREWRSGRWAAKQALDALTTRTHEPTDWQILPTSDGAPQVLLHGAPQPLSISISHSRGLAACALSSALTAIGCDLELVEPRDKSFVTDWFTPQERALVHHAPEDKRHELVTLIWSAKESALKALRTGLRRDTRSVEVDPPPEPSTHGWHPLTIRDTLDGVRVAGWWRRETTHVLTIVQRADEATDTCPVPTAAAG